MAKDLKIVGTGDALYVAAMPREYDRELAELRDFMSDCDARLTNFESNIEEFGDFAAAESGGTWINTPPADFDDLTRFGFNFYGTGNNHAGDFSTHGMLSTLDALEARGFAHAGTGRSMEEAMAPAVIECEDGRRVAVIAFTCDFKPTMQAGYASEAMKARPGVNYLRSEKIYPIAKEDVEILRRIAKDTRMNEYHEVLIATGYRLPDPEGIYRFGDMKFCYDGSHATSECNKADLARITDSIRRAKEEYGTVVVMSHCHGAKGGNLEELPDFIIELLHACVDAGASAIFGGGTHQLRPMEIYRGVPIFYSLGDFIYQGMRVHHLPADFMLAYGVDKNATAWEGLMARSQNNTKGLQTQECNFLTVLPRVTIGDDGRVCGVEMLPISLGFHREGNLNGLPYHAKGEEGRKIFDILDRLSRPYGTKLTYENDKIYWVSEDL